MGHPVFSIHGKLAQVSTLQVAVEGAEQEGQDKGEQQGGLPSPDQNREDQRPWETQGRNKPETWRVCFYVVC